MATLTPERLVAGWIAATDSIRDRVTAYVTALWTRSGSYRDADIDRLVALIVPRVQAGQIQVANLTDQYLGQMAALAGLEWSRNVDRDVINYRGTPADEVYRRPATALYTALTAGAPFEKAVDQGLNRLVSLVTTDIQQAKNRQAARSLGGGQFEFYRRVLTGRENCAKCTIASTQRYHRGTLMPIHPGCDCGVRPFRADADPGQVLDPELLESTHAAIEAKFGGTDRGARDLGLGKVDSRGRPLSDFTELIISHEHGELGPTLAWRADYFTGPAQLAA